MAFFICSPIVHFSELQMKNKSPLSAACINYCSNSREISSLLVGTNGSNFGLLPFAALSLTPCEVKYRSTSRKWMCLRCMLKCWKAISSLVRCHSLQDIQDLPVFESKNYIISFFTSFLKTVDCLLSHWKIMNHNLKIFLDNSCLH